VMNKCLMVEHRNLGLWAQSLTPPGQHIKAEILILD
jgi:hypothetical protein